MISNADAARIRRRLSHQDKLIFDFSIETGLRISDVLHIKSEQIAKSLTITESKTKKEKTVEISDSLFSRLKHFRAVEKGTYVFNSPRTLYKPLHRSTYHLHLKNASRATGVNFSAHSARKLYALNIFHQTGDIFAVQKALNHKYITTTCTYLNIDLTKLLGEIKPRKETNS